MSIFSRLDKLSSRAVDHVNAQRFRIIPRTDATNPNARRMQDSKRPLMEGWCVFEYNSLEFGMELGVRKSYREANDLRNVSVGRSPMVSIDRKYFPNVVDEPRQGDRLFLLTDDGQVDPAYPPFEIMDNQRDGLARLELRLTMIGNQT